MSYKLGKKIMSWATLPMDFFNEENAFVFRCKNCNYRIQLSIPYYSGGLVEHLEKEEGFLDIQKLLEQKIINLRDEVKQLNYSKYVLWNMNAHYLKINCSICSDSYITIFGMAELQPGREEIQFKGVWSLDKIES